MDPQYHRDKRKRMAALRDETRRALRDAARITAAAGLPDLSAHLADLARRWHRASRRGRPLWPG